MENQWNDPRILEAVETLLHWRRIQPDLVVEYQPRSFNLHPDEYALAYYLSKAVWRIANLVAVEIGIVD
jgi:hypothetical protein